MSDTPNSPARDTRYDRFVRAFQRFLTDIVAPITGFVIIYFILFGKVQQPAVALMLGGAASAMVGIPFWTRQDRRRRGGDDEGDDPGGGGFSITIGRAAPPRNDRNRQRDEGRKRG